MSTLLDLQNEIAVLINASEYLVQGGCEAFAEDKADTLTRLEIALWDRGGVAITVMTPVGRALGSKTETGIPLEIPAFMIQCQERPAANREIPGHITALQAAQHIAVTLDQPAFRFVDFIQGGDSDTEVVTVQVVFRTSITLTDPAIITITDSAEPAE